MLRLSVRVHAYDSLTDEFLAFCAYLILVFGDIPAVSMVIGMKGHYGLSLCQMCESKGVHILGSRATTHYVPLDHLQHPQVLQDSTLVCSYDPTHLLLHTHTLFMAQAHEQYGIKGVSALSVLSLLSFPQSFPYDFIHLLWENVVKNLMQLWTGTYKDLNEGNEQYQLATALWEETVFGPQPPNVASDNTSWMADTRRFLQNKYYGHFITTAEIEDVGTGLIKWVQTYKKSAHCAYI
ncbi:hypothetical protein C8Q73DRAFT_745629 [Cubamyces lactineus]|nr:hypothetical protein C8Q73DRAFT_745629 [Cubamyces lactineus]